MKSKLNYRNTIDDFAKAGVESAEAACVLLGPDDWFRDRFPLPSATGTKHKGTRVDPVATLTGYNNLLGRGGASGFTDGVDGNIILAGAATAGLAPLDDGFRTPSNAPHSPIDLPPNPVPVVMRVGVG